VVRRPAERAAPRLPKSNLRWKPFGTAKYQSPFHGSRRGVRLRYDPDPDDVEWAGLDSGRLAVVYPRLWALFGDHWREAP
jgi:hypothetical protein